MIALSCVFASVPLFAAIPDLTGIYVFCLIVGGALLIISTVFGGDHDVEMDGGLDLDLGGDVDVSDALDVGGADLDLDVDVDADALGGDHLDSAGDVGHHAGGLGLSNWLSMRFLVYFAAMFGLVGTVLTYMTDVSAISILGAALLSGIVMGQFVHQTIRMLQRTSGNSEFATTDFLQKTARVTVALRPPARGEVGVRLGDREVFVPAIAQRSDDVFETGAQVVITSYSGGLAEVVSRQEFEFTHNT
jgi:hypothetical protein